VCSDVYTGLTGTQISVLTEKNTVNVGSVMIGQTSLPRTPAPTTFDVGVATFQQVSGGPSFSATGGISEGSCSLNQTTIASTGTTPNVAALDAGIVTVTLPSGTAEALFTLPTVPGEYQGSLGFGAIPPSGGNFVFSAIGAIGGVGPFSTTINFPDSLLSWTNQSAMATVMRNTGQQFT